MLDRALAWAAAGWPVFPCNEDGHPAIKAWQKHATTDEEIIRSWWRDFPNSRVAAVPGLAGCFVIDVDVKNGKNGEATLSKLEEEYGFENWVYPQQSTPSGGRHVFMRGVFRTSVEDALGPGVDTRGGSRDGGGLGFIYCYQDEPPGASGEIPDAIPALLLSAPRKSRDNGGGLDAPRVEWDQPANIKKAVDFLKTQEKDPPPEGARNRALFVTAATLRDLAISEGKAFELFEEFPSVTGIPPLCEENVEEFNATVRSAYKNGQRQPGIDAIDEAARNKAAEGFSVSPVTSGIGTNVGGSVGEWVGAPEAQKNGRGTGGRKRFTLWSEERDRDPPPWLIRGLLPKTALAGMYGPGGSYKSFIVLDMALALASGAAEWGGQKISDVGAPVVYVAGEGSAAGRARAWEKIKGTSEMVGQRFVTYHGLDLMDENQLDGFREDLEALYGAWGRAPGLVVFDTMARAAPGQDENSAKDMGLLVARADSIKDWAQTCVLLVHHTPKANSEWRGSSAVWNALDVALEVRKKGTNSAALKLARTKDGPEGKAWRIALQETDTGRVRDDETERSLVVTAIEPVAQEKATAAPKHNTPEQVSQKLENATLQENRAQVAIRVLRAMSGQMDAVDGDTLAKYMALEMGGIVPKVLKAWLRAAPEDMSHPLHSYVVDALGSVVSFRAGVK